MSSPKLPNSFKKETKPSNFCPGCGHSLVLKTLGFAFDTLKIAEKTVFVTDIGCSLLAWDYFDVDTVQSNHGRAGCLAIGIKKAVPKSTIIAYMGDGGGYAIGLHHLLHIARRNDPITVILVNNTVFAMTGGQKAPTTMKNELTETTPEGKYTEEEPFFGPELVAQVASKDSFIARGSVDNIPELENFLKRAIENQTKNNAFSFVEILSFCPVNWKTSTEETIDFMNKMKNIYKVGVIRDVK